MSAGLFCICRQRFVGIEVQVALDGKSEWAAQFANLAHADESEFWRSHAEIAEAEGDVIEAELLGPAYASLSLLRCGPAESSMSRRSQACCSPLALALRARLKSVQNGSCRFSQ
jgi:hypothetical protein